MYPKYDSAKMPVELDMKRILTKKGKMITFAPDRHLKLSRA